LVEEVLEVDLEADLAVKVVLACLLVGVVRRGLHEYAEPSEQPK
jgi:hypothetical protein